MTNISIKVVLEIVFLNFNNANIEFAENELTWRSYTTNKTLPTIQKIEVNNKKEFAKVALNEKIEAFIVFISSLSLGLKMTIHLARKAQITLLLVEKVTTLAEYSDFADIFSKKLAEVLSEQTRANKHVIVLNKSK